MTKGNDMGYHSEQHLLYGGATKAAAVALPGREEPQDTDKGRIVVRRRLDDAPQCRYFPTHAEARSAGKRLRLEQWIVVVQYMHADGRWS